MAFGLLTAVKARLCVAISKANLVIHHQNLHQTLLFQYCNHVSDYSVQCLD